MLRFDLVKRTGSLLLVLVFMLSVFTGCQKPLPGQESSPASSTPEVSTSTPQEEQPEGRTDLPDSYIQISPEEMDLTVRDAMGANGVVSSASPIASKIGLEILKNGGNAVDAAVAVAFGLSMVEPNASGIGGDGYMLIYEAKTGEVTFLDYKGEAPAAFTLDFMKSQEAKRNYMHTGAAALVPGTVAGLCKANELFGTMTLAELVQPTIDYAEYGVEVTPHMAKVYMDSYDLLSLHPETARIFLNDFFPYNAGEIYKNPDIAETLRLIAKEGPDVFYKGEIAEDIVAALKEDGGVMTMADMAAYEVSVRESVSTTYRDYKVVTASPSSSGVVVLEALNMAELFDVKATGHNTPDTLHMWTEIFKLIGADRREFIGDPDYYDVTPALNLALKSFAKDRAKAIELDSVMLGAMAGKPIGYEGQHTTHVSVVDKDGNMVSMTNTLSDYFGCTITPEGRGFVLNDLGPNFSTSFSVNYPQPGKKVRSTVSPLLVFDPDGKPVLTIGTPGAGRIVTTMPQIISNILDFDMDIQTAINQQRIFQDREGALAMEGGIDLDTVIAMEKKGHIVDYRSENDVFFGGVHGVMILPDGTLHGGADPRRDGKALAY